MKPLFLVAIQLIVCVPLFGKSVDLSKPLSRLAFGGCGFQRAGQGHWEAIQAENPDLWIWNGDTIYADHFLPAMRQHEYNVLKNNRYYKAFEREIPILGTWDDHDYYSNSAGKNGFWKKESQKLFLDFLEEPLNSVRRTQTGVYTSYKIGTQGSLAEFILLDERTFRDEPGETSTILGETQWSWLEKTLTESSADIVFIVSSSMVLPEGGEFDRWAQYPLDLKHLLSLLDKQQQAVIILSGDRHLAEFSSRKTEKGKEIFEFTSSGLTHSTLNAGFINPYRVGELFTERNFGTIDFQWSPQRINLTYKIHYINGEVAQKLEASFARQN